MNSEKKTSVLQAVKAVAVLVIICLVCGALLAICNDLLYISDAERERRAQEKSDKLLAEVYPKFVKAEECKIDSNFATNGAFGSVTRVVKSTDGTYIIEAGGTGGYGGVVKVLVAVGSDAKILGWQISDVGGETQIDAPFKKSASSWYVGTEIATDIPVQKVAGTSMSSAAINNAIRMASYYAMNVLKLGSNPEGDAIAAVLEKLGADYANYKLSGHGNVLETKIDGQTVASILSDDTNKLSYYLTGTGDNGDVSAYVYGQGEDIKALIHAGDSIVYLNTDENDSIVSKVGNNPIYGHVMTKVGSYNAFALLTDVQTEGETTNYTVTGLSIGVMPGNYVLTVSVSGGTVTAITVVSNGFEPFGPEEADANILLTKLVGVNKDTVYSTYTSNAVGGATQSSDLITVAVLAALHYDALPAQNN